MGVHEVVSVHIQQRIRRCSHEHAQSHDKSCDYTFSLYSTTILYKAFINAYS